MAMKKTQDHEIQEHDVKDAPVIVDDDVTATETASVHDAAEDAVRDDASATHKRKTTYVAIMILLAGIAAGSFFVDIVQLFAGKGFSARALKDAQVVNYDGATWVRYDDPKVVVEVFDADDCEACVTDEMVTQLRTVVPTMEVHRVDVNTDAGKKYAAQQNIKYIPAFLFSDAIKEVEFYQQAQMLFTSAADGKYQFDTAAIGMPVGKYIAVPGTDGIVMGNESADVHVVVFADYTAPDIQALTEDLDAVRTQYGDKVQVVVKALVNPQQPNAQKMSEAVLCANAQDGYAALRAPYLAARAQLLTSKNLDADLSALAQKAQLDVARFDSCMKDAQTAQQLTANNDDARGFAVRALPSAFVNGEEVKGAVTRDALTAQIDAHIGGNAAPEATEKKTEETPSQDVPVAQ